MTKSRGFREGMLEAVMLELRGGTGGAKALKREGRRQVLLQEGQGERGGTESKGRWQRPKVRGHQAGPGLKLCCKQCEEYGSDRDGQ